MSYKDYQNARDAAWRILLDCGVERLPINLNEICKALGIRIFSYHAANDVIERNGLSEIAKQTDGLTFYAQETPVVLFDEKVLPQRITFTVAHELGHIMLKHVRPGGVTLRNKEPQPRDAPEETAANQFAVRLLAPACVLWGLNVQTPDEISYLCHISRQAAEFRAQRMAELYRRNKFLASPLEREVYRQFLPFIRATGYPQMEE